MNGKKMLRIVCFLLCLMLVFAGCSPSQTGGQEEEGVRQVLSRYGSRGNEVKKIQTKLKNWGYYSGSVDGIYGTKTKEAVIWFQKKNGLTADGVAGPKTLAAMGISVILNRVKHPSFPNTLAGVVYQKGAFDAVADGQVNLTPNSTAYQAADAALGGWDPTGGCIYYYNPKTATNAWIRSLPISATFGNHVFSKG